MTPPRPRAPSPPVTVSCCAPSGKVAGGCPRSRYSASATLTVPRLPSSSPTSISADRGATSSSSQSPATSPGPCSPSPATRRAPLCVLAIRCRPHHPPAGPAHRQPACHRAGVIVQGQTGPRPACGLDFRHRSAVHLLRSGVPLTRVQSHLGHACVDTTPVYLRLTNRDRRSIADRIDW